MQQNKHVEFRTKIYGIKFLVRVLLPEDIIQEGDFYCPAEYSEENVERLKSLRRINLHISRVVGDSAGEHSNRIYLRKILDKGNG